MKGNSGRLLAKVLSHVDNSKNIQGHEIILSRRKCNNAILSSQFHLLNNRLFMVQDEFSTQCHYNELNLKKSLNGYYKNTIGAPGVNISSKTLTDRKGNFLSVTTRNHFMARYISMEFRELQEAT